MTAAISRCNNLNSRLPRQHLKTHVFKCFLAMTALFKFRGVPQSQDAVSGSSMAWQSVVTV